MAFVRSFVCIISVIATDKVRYSMVPGRTEREDGGEGGDAAGIRNRDEQ